MFLSYLKEKQYKTISVIDNDNICLHNITLAFTFSLRDLNVNCQMNVINEEVDLIILIGPTPLPPNYKGDFGIYQTEQYNTSWLRRGSEGGNDNHYMNRLMLAQFLIDYSEKNRKEIKCKIQYDKEYFFIPFYYHPCLDSRMNMKTDPLNGCRYIDVLLVGNPSPRRNLFIDKLRSIGLTGFIAINKQQEITESMINHSKICVNVHSSEEYTILETSRISWLLSCDSFVISEKGEEDDVNNMFKNYLTFVDSIEDLPILCKQLLYSHSPSFDELRSTAKERCYKFKNQCSLINFIKSS